MRAALDRRRCSAPFSCAARRIALSLASQQALLVSFSSEQRARDVVCGGQCEGDGPARGVGRPVSVPRVPVVAPVGGAVPAER